MWCWPTSCAPSEQRDPFEIGRIEPACGDGQRPNSEAGCHRVVPSSPWGLGSTCAPARLNLRVNHMLSKSMGSWGIGLRLAGAALVVALAANCAAGEKAVVDDNSGGGDDAAGGNAGVGGDGGLGGSGGDPLPCGMDCGSIPTPSCRQAICDVDLGKCVVVPGDEGATCDDGKFCTVEDVCVEGTCAGPVENTCGNAISACQTLTCDEQTETCSQTVNPDGASCESENLCMVGSVCTGGTCIGTVNDCFFAPVPDDCHAPVCNPVSGMCEPVVSNEAGPCSDAQDLCTAGKTCAQGLCQGGAPKDCTSQDSECKVGVCDGPTTGQCVPMPILAGSPCPESTDSCNQGSCDAVGTCIASPINETLACDDGVSCTAGTTCTAGQCDGGTSTVTVYFSEDFSSNVANWTLGAEWGIGAAVSSPAPGSCGNGDPGMDNTSTSDNGIAGVAIGGVAQQTIHPMEYLTSPVVDTSTAVGAVVLGYHRWLNSDYTPYMKNVVEVFDGTAWVIVWETFGSPGVQDAAWTFMQHDLTAYKNAAMQVRFGFLVGSTGVFSCPQWNVDDVLIADGACP